MRITLLKVENFQRIKDIEIAPGDRNLMLIAGRNRQGKSSLLRAMTCALGGGKEAPLKPVRDGQASATITIELEHGELVIEKRFSAYGKTSLEVRAPDGKKSSPQKILNGIVGERFLDPLEFMRLKEKEQRETLLGLVDVGVDLDELAAKRQKAYDERTDLNREVKRLEGWLDLAPVNDVDESERQDVTQLVTKLEILNARDAEGCHARRMVDVARANVPQAAQRLSAAKTLEARTCQDIEVLREKHEAELADADKRSREAQEGYWQAKKAADKADILVEEAEEAAAEYDERPGPLILEAKQAIDAANTHNEELAQRLVESAQRSDQEKQLLKFTAQADNKTTVIDGLDTTKRDALKDAKMPIEGLDVNDACVVFEGVPLAQASGAERLRVSLGIASALSPHLRDIWIEDGALLDSDSLELVGDFATKNDLRVWLERVGDLDDDCLILEDGEIVKKGEDHETNANTD